MRKLLMLAAVAALSAACHNRPEEEVGAAPDQAEADTTGVTHAIDTTRTGPPGVGGRPGDATVTLDSVGVDSSQVQTDTTAGDTSPTSTPQDTLGPSDIGADDAADTTTTQSDTTGTWSDTTAADTSSTNQ
ncbi:MAG TPA: hypothetical protein VHH32_09860 [Gemmatimonadales bacterium]|nr:hypothetical protein [Gemmatimonadales bacterium]